uniref:Uncharacterized protein n=1 Tax=Salix viminalis TaxID=40686 RepID=A0A6N2N0Q1_SALVM
MLVLPLRFLLAVPPPSAVVVTVLMKLPLVFPPSRLPPRDPRLPLKVKHQPPRGQERRRGGEFAVKGKKTFEKQIGSLTYDCRERESHKWKIEENEA